MFTRRVHVTLRPDTSPERACVTEVRIIPQFRGQTGHPSEYPKSLKPPIDDVVVGLPKVGTFEGSDAIPLRLAA